MRNIAVSLLVSFFCVTNTVAQPSEWLQFGNNETASYDILRASAQFDKETSSAQFILKTTFHAPTATGVKTQLESTLVLCGPEILITMSERQFDETGKYIGVNLKGSVYPNPEEKSSIITSLIKLSCGTKV